MNIQTDTEPGKVIKQRVKRRGRHTDEWYNRWLTRKAKYIIAQDREKHTARKDRVRVAAEIFP